MFPIFPLRERGAQMPSNALKGQHNIMNFKGSQFRNSGLDKPQLCEAAYTQQMEAGIENADTQAPYKGLIRPLRALERPQGPCKALKGLVRPLKAL